MSESIEQLMSQCTGSEIFYRFPLSRAVYTEGVNLFVEKCGAWWFVVDAITTSASLKQPFVAVKLLVKNGKADVLYTDGDEVVLKKKHYSYTDCQDCDLTFYYIDNTFLYSGEY